MRFLRVRVLPSVVSGVIYPGPLHLIGIGKERICHWCHLPVRFISSVSVSLLSEAAFRKWMGQIGRSDLEAALISPISSTMKKPDVSARRYHE